MSIHPLLDFAIAHPWLAFGLAWPFGLTLVAICMQVSVNIDTAMRLVHAYAAQVSNLVVVMIKGYPPANTPPIVALQQEDEQ